MVRLDIYDSNSNNTGRENKDTKHNLEPEFYSENSVIFPYCVDTGSGQGKPGGAEHDTSNPGGPGSSAGQGKGRDRSKEEKDAGDVGQVWWNFLAETSLHGCKNVKERQIVKR